MIVEVRGTGTHNKGAELMLCAIRQYLSGLDANVQLAVNPLFGTFAERAEYGLLSKVRAGRLGRSRVVQHLMSPAFRRSYGMVVDSEIDAVLDAAGFAYGDPWGSEPTERAAQQSVESKRRGQPVVLLPQAFGPFSTRKLAASARRLIESSSLVFARDAVSYQHVQELGGPYTHVRQAPDFTNIVKGVVPSGLDLPAKFACIVPNIRMLDRGHSSEQQSYISFLATCIRESRDRELTPLFLFHDESTDRQVAEKVEQELGSPLLRISECRPERLKGILGRATVVIGSRFHALVGALSQAVPCIATGWSHKYLMLLEDYGCPELLLKASSPPEDVRSLLDNVTLEESRSAIVKKLQQNGIRQRQQIDEMFALTTDTLGLISESVCS